LRRLVALLEAVADHALHDPVQCYRIIALYYFCGLCCHGIMPSWVTTLTLD
jgi:hypothetical protein